MKKVSALTLALVVFVTSSAFAAASQEGTRIREKQGPKKIVRIIKKIFGIQTLEDGLGPPKPCTTTGC
jgi:hypothetical protein